MTLMTKQIFNFIFFVFIINTYSLKAHDSYNGGCGHHCKKSNKSIVNEKIKNDNNVKEKFEDNYSCLTKSLCRG